MTRQPHDQFAKQYLEELLAPLGQVETSREVSPEVRQVDVWFVPTRSPSTEPQNLGLLGKMAATACLLEPFRNAPSPVEVLDCQSKLNSLAAASSGNCCSSSGVSSSVMVAIQIPFANMFLLDDLTHENVGLALLAIAL